MEENEGMDA